MNNLLRPRIWSSFLASSGVPSTTLRTGSPCDVPFRYASEPIPRYRGTVARWHAHLRGLATAIHKISGLEANYTYHQSTPLTCQPGIIIHFAFYLSQRAQSSQRTRASPRSGRAGERTVCCRRRPMSPIYCLRESAANCFLLPAAQLEICRPMHYDLTKHGALVERSKLNTC